MIAKLTSGGRDDTGATLIFALAFIVICGVFALAGLRIATGSTLAGERAVDRNKLQYALDAGVSRAINVIQKDASTSNPQYCPEVAGSPSVISTAADPSGFSVNGDSIQYSCQTLSGGVHSQQTEDKNYAILVTSTANDALQTQSASSSALNVNGSVYLSSDEANSALKKSIVVDDGSIVEGPTGAACVTDPTGAGSIGSNLSLKSPATDGKAHFKGCTGQKLSDAIPTLTLPNAQPPDLSAVSLPGGTDAYFKGYLVPNSTGSKSCRVFAPGTYKTKPQLTNDGNYFMTGYYDFDNVGTLSVPNGAVVIAGKSSDTDPVGPFSASNDTCTGQINDATALAALPAPLAAAVVAYQAAVALENRTLATGVEWVFGGNSQLTSGAPLVLNKPCPTPAVGGGTCPQGLGINGELPISIYQSPSSPSVDPNKAGLPAWATARPWNGGGNIVDTNNANAAMSFGGQIYAPDAPVSIFTSNPGSAGAAAGIVAETLSLNASVPGTGQLNLVGTALSHAETPPKRVVRIVSSDASGSSNATNVAIVTVFNFTYRVVVNSWRTGAGAN